MRLFPAGLDASDCISDPATASPRTGRRAVSQLGVLAGLLLASLLAASPASAIRIMTYNLLNYSSGRTGQFQTVLQETAPDVLVVQEISSSGVNNFLSTVLDVIEPDEWEAGPFVNGPDTDNAIYVRSSTADVADHFVVSTTLRDIDEWTVRPAGYDGGGADIRLYVVHLKASQGSTNEQRRLDEVTAMRTRMESFPPGQSYAVLGDFNIYDSFEPAYGYMLSTTPGLAGVVQDPIDTPGNWHNSSSFASIHTQSPRTDQFGGGANGGMDDRFDIILVAPSLQDDEGLDCLPSTYTAFGQDGLHFNAAIIDNPPNAVVSAAVAQALHDASDHLPVFCDFQLPPMLLADAALDLSDVIVGGVSEVELLSVENTATLPADELDYTLAAPPAFMAPVGPFTAEAGAGANLHAVSLDTGTPGDFAGLLDIDSDAPETPLAQVALTGRVLRHAVASIEAGTETIEGTVDFGTHPPGGFTDEIVQAHNFGFDALQALLEVYDAELAGDPRFSIVGGFDSALVDDSPALYFVRFDDAGTPDGVYDGTLTLRTRDQQDLSGATEALPLVLDLLAEVDDTATGVPTGPLVSYEGLGAIAPNPFLFSAEIRFGLRASGPVRISIFDTSGRAVRTLSRRDFPAGEHRIVWDGSDERGRAVAAGMFYVRVNTEAGTQTGRIVRIR